MSDYIHQLEAQNEELKQLLIKAEEYVVWKDRRLHFIYVLEATYKDNQTYDMRFVPRFEIVSILDIIKTDGIKKVLKLKYKGQKVKSFKISLWGVNDRRFHPLREPPHADAPTKVIYELH